MPPLKQFKTIQIGDLQTGLFQGNVEDFTRQIENVSPLGGAFIRVQFVSASTDTAVNHGQESAAVEWLTCSQTAAGSVYKSPTTSSQPQSILMLRASAPMTVLLWVFPTPEGT